MTGPAVEIVVFTNSQPGEEDAAVAAYSATADAIGLGQIDAFVRRLTAAFLAGHGCSASAVCQAPDPRWWSSTLSLEQAKQVAQRDFADRGPTILVFDAAAPSGQDSLIRRLTDRQWAMWLGQNEGTEVVAVHPAVAWWVIVRCLALAFFSVDVCSEPRCLLGPVTITLDVPVRATEGLCHQCQRRVAPAHHELAESLASFIAANAPVSAAPATGGLDLGRLARISAPRLRCLAEGQLRWCLDVDDDLLAEVVAGGAADQSIETAAEAFALAQLQAWPLYSELIAATRPLRDNIDYLGVLSGKRYQDHTIHSAAVLAFGVMLMRAPRAGAVSAAPGRDTGDQAQPPVYHELCASEEAFSELLRAYALASLTHDLGYTLHHLTTLVAVPTPRAGPRHLHHAVRRVLERLFEPIDGAEESAGGTEPARALEQVAAELTGRSEDGSLHSYLTEEVGRLVGELQLEAFLPRGQSWERHHGVLSAWIVHRLSASDGSRPPWVLAALRALALHDIDLGELSSRLDQLPAEGSIPAGAQPSSLLARCPLLWTLLLSDYLHVWQRPVWTPPEYLKELPRLRIRGIAWPLSAEHPVLLGDYLQFCLAYDNAETLSKTGWEYAKLDGILSGALKALGHPHNPPPFNNMTFTVTTAPGPRSEPS